jgi:hypothetical protein
MSEKHNNGTPMKWVLTWYQADADDFVGEVDLPLSTEEVKKLFYIQENEDAYGCNIVRASQRIYLQPIVDYEIDLNQFDYFVEDQAI